MGRIEVPFPSSNSKGTMLLDAFLCRAVNASHEYLAEAAHPAFYESGAISENGKSHGRISPKAGKE
jgi:hypothetical protein